MLTQVSDFFGQLNWITIVSALISGLTGVMTGTLITYKLNGKREKEKLRRDLQIKAVDNILKDIKLCLDKLLNISAFIADFEFLLDLSDKESIIKNFSDVYLEYQESYENFIHTLDTRAIIFIKFQNIKNSIGSINANLFKEYIRLQNIFNELRYNNFKSNLNKDQKKIVATSCEFIEKNCLDLNKSFSIFIIDLQNEFLSDLFKCTLPKKE